MSPRIRLSSEWSRRRASRVRATLALGLILCSAVAISCAKPLRGTAIIAGVTNAPIEAARGTSPPPDARTASTSRRSQPRALTLTAGHAGTAPQAAVGTSGASDDGTAGGPPTDAGATDSGVPLTDGAANSGQKGTITAGGPAGRRELSAPARQSDRRLNRHLAQTALTAVAALAIILIGRRLW